MLRIAVCDDNIDEKNEDMIIVRSNEDNLNFIEVIGRNVLYHLKWSLRHLKKK